MTINKTIKQTKNQTNIEKTRRRKSNGNKEKERRIENLALKTNLQS